MADSLIESPSTSQWPDNDSEYELKEIIGVGSIAHVYSAYCKPRNEKCAIKVIDISKFNTSTTSLLQQVKVMFAYKHPNLISYHTGFVVNDSVWLVLSLLGGKQSYKDITFTNTIERPLRIRFLLEACPPDYYEFSGGSLRDTINYKLTMTNRKHGVFDEITVATVLKSVLRGLEYLNKKGQTHRNIKAANILVGDNGSIKITDFGINSWLAPGRVLSRREESGDFVGLPCWMAPEVMDPDEKSDSKADIWSVGITAIEIATGNPPYYKYPPMKVINLTLLNDPPNLDTGAEQKDQYKMYGKTFRKFITLCLNKEPAKRPTATLLLQHPFLQRAKDNKLITQTVVPVGPSYVTRVLKTKKKPEPEERVHLRRTRSGEWEWRKEVIVETIPEERRSTLKTIWSSLLQRMKRGSLESKENTVKDGVDDSDSLDSQQEPQMVVAEVHEIKAGPSSAIDRQPTEQEPSAAAVPITYRHRKNGVLQDVTFKYALNKESPESVAAELVREGILDPRDSVPVSDYLTRLLENYVTNQATFPSFTFPLNSAGPNAEYDDASLRGFGCLFVAKSS